MAKFILIKLEIRDGERSYTEIHLAESDSTKSIKKQAKEYLNDFYGEDCEHVDEWVEGDGGEVMARIQSVVEIPEIDYNILRKYL
jgi:hypothetical protein